MHVGVDCHNYKNLAMARWSLFCLTVLSGMIGHQCRTTEIDFDVLSQFTSPPTVSFGKLIPGITRLLIPRLPRCNSDSKTGCSECLDKASLLKLINASETEIPSHLGRLSVIILDRLVNLEAVCLQSSADNCADYAECNVRLFHGETEHNEVSLHNLEGILRKLGNIYSPSPDKQCFSGEQLLQNSTKTPEPSEAVHIKVHEKLAASLLYHLLQGECINVSDAVTDFMDYLFNEYGENEAINSTGLANIFSALKINSEDHHNHHHPHLHKKILADKKHHHPKHHHHSSHHGHPDVHSDSIPEIVMHNKDHYEHSHEHSDHEDDSRSIMEDDHHSNSPGIILFSEESAEINMTRKKRSVDHDHNHENSSIKCLGMKGIMDRFAAEYPLKKEDFIQICPALIQQAVSGVCKHEEKDESKQNLKTKLSNLELYGYSSLAVFVISLTSIMVVIILPLMGKRVYQYLLMGLIGLSFGTMSGDALLHLMPQALGLHSHDHSNGNDDHSHDHDDHSHDDHSHEGPLTLDSIPTYFWRQLGIMGAIYAVFLFETLVELFQGNGEGHGHGHSHIPEKLPSQLDRKKQPKAESVMELTSYKSSTTTLSDSENPEKPAEETEVIFKSPIVICGLSSMALMITLADTVHNIGDGLAIGAAFSSGLQNGLSTSIAVFCHELPHEFGDFVVLLSTGLSFKKALLINCLSALSCFIGLYAGIAVGTANASGAHWVMTITAGIFLYVAMVEMLPELKRGKSGLNPFGMFAIKNFGVLLGIGLMIVIALYEDRIGVDL